MDDFANYLTVKSKIEVNGFQFFDPKIFEKCEFSNRHNSSANDCNHFKYELNTLYTQKNIIKHLRWSGLGNE